MYEKECTSIPKETKTPYLAALVVERVYWNEYRSALTAVGQFLSGRKNWQRTHCWLWVNGVMFNPCFDGYFVQQFDYSWLEQMTEVYGAEVYYFTLQHQPVRARDYKKLNPSDFIKAWLGVPSTVRGWVCSEYVAALYNDPALDEILTSGVLITPDDLMEYTKSVYPGYLNTRRH